MHISLTPELERLIKDKVATGLYNNASEVIREALRFVQTHEEWIYEIKLEKLRERLSVGLGQAARAEFAEGTGKEAVERAFRQALAETKKEPDDAQLQASTRC